MSRLIARLAVVLCLALRPAAHAAPEAVSCLSEPTDMTINYRDVIDCQIDSSSDSDLFRFLGTAGEAVTLSTNGGAAPCLELIRPDGARDTACFGGFSQRLDVELFQTGQHAIRVTGSFTDSYTLVTERLIPPSRDRVAIKYGDLSQGDLDPQGDFDLYVFRGSAGDVITIDVGGSAAPCIELVAPDNGREGACFGGFSQRLDTTLAQDGTYAVLVNGSFAGAYDLSVQCILGPCVPAFAACTTNDECNDGNACTADACNVADPAADALGCLHVAIPASACDDADSCTTDACDAGVGCTHTAIPGCPDVTSECAGKPDLTPCGAPAGSCHLACCSGQCASELLCDKTSATPAAGGAPRINVTCQATGAGGNEFCETQGFAAKAKNAVRPALAAPAGLKKVTKKVRREIDASGQASFQIGLNKYGKKLLKKARKSSAPLSVTLVFQLGSDAGTSLLTETVTLN